MKKNQIDMEKVKYVNMGRKAFENGLPRIPIPTDPEQARLWLYGYDIAKRFHDKEILGNLTQIVQ